MSPCLWLTTTVSLEGEGQVTLDAGLTGGPDPESSTCPTASSFGTMVAERSFYELGPFFLALSPDTTDFDYDRHTHTRARSTPELEVTTTQITSIASEPLKLDTLNFVHWLHGLMKY